MKIKSDIVEGAEFARNWICKESGWKLQGREYSRKGPTIATVWICKEWIYPGNQEVESARISICKERNLQGTEIARNGNPRQANLSIRSCASSARISTRTRGTLSGCQLPCRSPTWWQTGMETSSRSSPDKPGSVSWRSMSGSLQMLLGTRLVIVTSGGRNDPSPVKRSS